MFLKTKIYRNISNTLNGTFQIPDFISMTKEQKKKVQALITKTLLRVK